jgi:hypothetical protein
MPRPSPIMSDSQHRNPIAESNKHNVVRKVVNGKSPHVWIRKARKERPRRRELLEMSEGSLNFSSESLRHLLVSFAIPGDRLAKLTFRGSPQADMFQRDNTSL